MTPRTLDGRNLGGSLPARKTTVKTGGFAALSQDAFAIEPEHLRSVEVDMTTFDGKVIDEPEPAP